jgi:hypothetical protein
VALTRQTPIYYLQQTMLLDRLAPVVDPYDEGGEEGEEEAKAHHDAIADALQAAWNPPCVGDQVHDGDLYTLYAHGTSIAIFCSCVVLITMCADALFTAPRDTVSSGVGQSVTAPGS